MKKIMCLIAAVIVTCSMFATTVKAELITIDTDTVSDEELAETIQLLIDEQERRRTENPVNENELQGIVFRNIPWHSTLSEVEAVMGDDNIISDNLMLVQTEHKYNLGFTATYQSVDVAGNRYVIAYLCFIYPTFEGGIVEDNELAELIYAFYDFQFVKGKDDFYNNIGSKLVTLYGDYTKGEPGKYKWEDTFGNYIILDTTHNGTLFYYSSDAEELINYADQVYDKALQDSKEGLY